MKKREIGILIIIILLAFAFQIYFNVIKKTGKYVVVKIDGIEVERYDLYKDGVYELNNGTNILCIDNKNAYLKYANCPDKFCVNQGKINELNETIICLPNRISIIIQE